MAGIGLLAAFAGRIGLLSDILDPLKVNVVFTTTAVVLAICFVAAPFYVRQAIASFETLDKDILDAARVDGASPFRLLLSISIPLASTGLAAGAALAFARGIGEFGATDHVRRQPARHHSDAAPADLPGLRAQLRRRARHRRAARDRQRGRPDRRQAARAPARQGARRGGAFIVGAVRPGG